MRLLFVGLLTLCIFALLHLCQVVSLRPGAYALVAIDIMTRVLPLVAQNGHRQYRSPSGPGVSPDWSAVGPYPYIQRTRHAMARWENLSPWDSDLRSNRTSLDSL